MYQHGHKAPELISPDNWQMDFHFMERPNARRVQLDLFYDYRTNVALTRTGSSSPNAQFETLIFWGAARHFLHAQRRGSNLRDLHAGRAGTAESVSLAPRTPRAKPPTS